MHDLIIPSTLVCPICNKDFCMSVCLHGARDLVNFCGILESEHYELQETIEFLKISLQSANRTILEYADEIRALQDQLKEVYNNKGLW